MSNQASWPSSLMIWIPPKTTSNATVTTSTEQTASTIQDKVPEIFVLLGALLGFFAHPTVFIAGCLFGIAENRFGDKVYEKIQELAKTYLPLTEEHYSYFSPFFNGRIELATTAAVATFLVSAFPLNGAAFYMGRKFVLGNPSKG